MPTHAAPKPERPDRFANIAVATFVVLAAVGVTTDAIARPRSVSRRDDWLDELISDAAHPDKEARHLASVFEPKPKRTTTPPPVVVPTPAPVATPPVKPHKPASEPVKPAKHRKPGKPVEPPEKPPELSTWGRHHHRHKVRIPPFVRRLLIEASASNMPSWNSSEVQHFTSGEHSQRSQPSLRDAPKRGTTLGSPSASKSAGGLNELLPKGRSASESEPPRTP